MKGSGRRKVRIGKVVSDKMDKTVVVEVERRTSHPVFKKVITLHKRFKVHDKDNGCKIGDTVKIIETRPISKEKRWRVIEKIQNTK